MVKFRNSAMGVCIHEVLCEVTQFRSGACICEVLLPHLGSGSNVFVTTPLWG